MLKVSVIVPCFNEESTIGLLLDALITQTIPIEWMEVVIADGMSTDLTREEINRFQQGHPEIIIRIVDNHKGDIPSGLNRAIEASRGEYIVRLDAHSIPNSDYIARCIQALEHGKGENIGGVWKINPGNNGWIAKSISVAASHPLGVGGAVYRIGGKAQPIDTVPFGAFRRELIEKVGNFDESLLSNEDYEFNTRIRQAGGIVWFDPEIQSTYFSRTDLGSLAKQYWRYGYWKLRMLRKYPESIRWRQALPPLFIVNLFVFSVLGFVFPALRIFLCIEFGLYLGVVLVAGIISAWKHKEPSFLIGLPLAIMTMHFSWGTAFLWSCLESFILGK